jgi:hypothetical protein
MVAILLIIHMLFAVALLGAITHQAVGALWPARARATNFVGRFRATQGSAYVNAVVVLYAVTALLGAVLYPVYRLGARAFMESLRMFPYVGSFEVKEHLVALGLGLLPAYWWLWKDPQNGAAVIAAVASFAPPRTLARLPVSSLWIVPLALTLFLLYDLREWFTR